MSETTGPPLPLEGIKVVEVAQALAGPFAGEILAHMGADVVKVERPEGDEARGWGPPFTPGAGPTFHAVNMNKRSIVLDLKDPRAIAWLKEYLTGADVLVQNLRPGVIEELGLGSDVLLELNPRLVFCSLWAFGNGGPRRLRPGYEPMVQAFAGLFSINGGEEDPPSRFGAPVLDLGTGMWAAMGVLAALHRRARTGRGGVVDASLFETALGWLTGHIAGYKFTGDLPSRERTGSRRPGARLAEPQTEAMGLLQHVPGLDLDLMSLPVSFDGRRPPVRRRAPTLGEHTKDIVDLPPAAG